MSLKLYSAIYFDSKGLSSGLPVDNDGVSSDLFDWTESIVNGIGRQSVSLFCQARPRRKIQDFYNYFSQNEVIWYKFLLSRSTRILKILRVHTYDLEDSIFKATMDPFPAYEYTFSAEVTDVDITDDELYETYQDFHIKYDAAYSPPNLQ